MKLMLVIAGQFPSCAMTQKIWYEECIKNNIVLDTFDLDDENGESLAKKLDLKSFPALILGEKIIAVGHPDKKIAKHIIRDLV